MNAETRQQQWSVAIADAESQFNEIAAIDGNLVTFRREANFAHQIIESSSYLQRCSAVSIFNAVVNIASVGLTLSPAEKLAYLVPRYSKEQRMTLCCLDISYRGLKKIAEDSGAIKTAVAELVYSFDKFRWVDKLTKPEHEYDPMALKEHRGDVRGGYCMAVLPSGIVQCEPMSLEDIEKIQNTSEAKNGPWKSWWEEMAKKSLVRRASKMWPHSARLQTAVAVLDAHQGLEMLTGLGAEPAPTPVVEQPGPVEPPKATGADKPAAAGKPITEGQLRIIRAKLKNAALNDADLCARFGTDKAEDLKFSQFAEVQEWIVDRAKTVA